MKEKVLKILLLLKKGIKDIFFKSLSVMKKHKKATVAVIIAAVIVFLLFPRKYEMWVTDGGSHYWGYDSPVYDIGYYRVFGGSLEDEERPVYEGMKVSVFGNEVYRR